MGVRGNGGQREWVSEGVGVRRSRHQREGASEGVGRMMAGHYRCLHPDPEMS